MVKPSLRCKITVLKCNLCMDLIENYLEEEYHARGPCEIFKEGQEFLFNDYDALAGVPEGFCPSAWADIRQDIYTVMVGGNSPGFKTQGTVVSGCTDWFRPVIFKIERIEEKS